MLMGVVQEHSRSRVRPDIFTTPARAKARVPMLHTSVIQLQQPPPILPHAACLQQLALQDLLKLERTMQTGLVADSNHAVIDMAWGRLKLAWIAANKIRIARHSIGHP